MSASTTPNGRTQSLSEPSKVSKNPKACEECRRRKQKCDGRTTCSLCIKRSSVCSYRSYVRQRGGKTSSTHRTTPTAHNFDTLNSATEMTVLETAPEPDTTNEDEPSGGLPKSMPPRLAIFNNIRATQDTSRGKTELFYGASSPFSALQHLDAHLPMHGAPAAYPDPASTDVDNGDKSIRSYNYQNIVFDHLSDSVPQTSGCDLTSYASAKIALRNFLVTASPRLPFLDSGDLCANFEKLYSANGQSVLASADRALVVAALGLGAFPLSDLPHRQYFFAQARAEAVNIMYDINTKTVQATLMLSQFEFETGSPNICYLHLGGAIRKAFAAGVHRNDTSEAKQTMWSLYCNESLVCFILGKHPTLADHDIIFPQSQDSSFMAYFVRLCAIVRSAHRLYHLDDTVVADLNAAGVVHQQLCEFSTELKENTRLEIGSHIYALAGEELAWHITFSYVFNATKLLLFRPFLLLCLELRRRGVGNILKERNGGVEMAVIYEAASRSVTSAQDIINLCDSLFSLGIGIEGIFSHGFYLESACFVLALAAVHPSNYLTPDCFEKLHTGLRLVRQLGPHEPARSISAAVEQMIDRIHSLAGRPASSAQEAVSDEPSFGSGSPSNLTMPSTVSSAAVTAFESFPDDLTPEGWDHEISLDDLWSMMDWNVGFPSTDPALTIMPGL
ncbi:hypothetical protein C7974DRAFT_388043 [Boeremia exigua]|uniref:uncharacterized protein n=1 Tax=Boeremia exigua TaxID=749465 RepID=UPI001E8E3805|nr:uncharacterized protein C7974DRAFT_388043 [Boeremia exigua]KAH6639219.1 hypothetical protein C7974DRAFT_388043 [Boeremia exigua]